MAEETETNRSRGGSYCIAPGCSNELYRAKAAGVTIHFHRLPLTRKPGFIAFNKTESDTLGIH